MAANSDTFELVLPKSPITGGKVRLVDTYDVADIVRLYKEQENLEVGEYFRHGDTLYLLECQDIGYRFYYPTDAAGDEAFYQSMHREAERKGHKYERAWETDHECGLKQVNEDDHVLEIGFNTGTFLERVLERTKNAFGLEFNSEALEKAQERGLAAAGESIEDHAKNNPEKYDLICAFQVLEHITDVRPFLTAAIAALKPTGKLVFSVPNNEPYFQRFSKYDPLNMPPHHAGLWNLKAFTKMAEHFDLRIDDHLLYDQRGPIVDAYLMAKLLTDVRSLPVSHTLFEKMKMLSVVPYTVPRSLFDYAFRKIRNHANIAVVLKKN